MISWPALSNFWYSAASSSNHSSARLVDGPRRIIGTTVSHDCAAPTFGCVSRKLKTARVSVSDSGNSPAPPCV